VAQDADAGSPAGKEIARPRSCYACGAPLEGEGLRCPRCGRRQMRTCYCGNLIPVTAARCPYCGADWSAAFRVRRRSARRKINWLVLAGYATAGALATIVLAAMTMAVVDSLALRSLPPGQLELPGSFAARAGLALRTVQRGVGRVTDKLASAGASLWAALAMPLLGALAGALIYLRRSGYLRWRSPFRRRPIRRRRKGVY
jgi:RNA polymerase subunit RPABC4/transcription elongation factor Spt4